MYPLEWDKDIKGDQLRTRLLQAKTKQPIWVTLHPVAKAILEKRRALYVQGMSHRKVFHLPCANEANAVIQRWVDDAGIEKKITWSCTRLSFSILLQDKNVDNATVAALLGHTSTKYVETTYKRHRPKDQTATINNLPHPVKEAQQAFTIPVFSVMPRKASDHACQVPIKELFPAKMGIVSFKKGTG